MGSAPWSSWVLPPPARGPLRDPSKETNSKKLDSLGICPSFASRSDLEVVMVTWGQTQRRAEVIGARGAGGGLRTYGVVGEVGEQDGVLPAVHAQPADVSPPSGAAARQRGRQSQETARVPVGLRGVRVDARRAASFATPLLRVGALGARRLSAQVKLFAGRLPQRGVVLGAFAAAAPLLLLGGVKGDDGDLDVALSRLCLRL